MNERVCREAVANYKRKWLTREGLDVRAFSDWDHKVNDRIKRKITSLRKRHINRRRKHILKSRKHLESLKLLHDKYVFVPADKTVFNVIIVCKKYYLAVVANEITATTTYQPVIETKEDIIREHLLYMRNNSIVIKHELHCLPSFYWLPKLHKQPYGGRFISASYKCTTKPLSYYLPQYNNDTL